MGVEAAVEAAVDGLGADRVAAALPLLQPLALPRPMRRRLAEGEVALDALREEVQRRTGTPEVHLERLERVRPRTLLSIVALTAAFYFLLPQLANIGDTVNAFGEAEWSWMILVLAGSALTYFFAAVSFVGSVAEPVPFAPALRSRIASSFTSSITPAGTGGMALGMRTLQRTGLDPASATASIGINQVAGVLVHIALLFAFVTWTGRSGLGGFSLPDSTLLLGGIAVVLGLTGVALAFRKVRKLVLDPVLRARVRRSVKSRVCSAARCECSRCSAARPAPRSRTSLPSSPRSRPSAAGSASRRSAPRISVRRSSATRHRPQVDSVPSKPRSSPRYRVRSRERARGLGGADVPARDLLVADAAGLVRVPLDATAR